MSVSGDTDPKRDKASRPKIGFDLDGVLAQPPLGLNIAISRRAHLPPLPESYLVKHPDEARSRSLLHAGIEALKYKYRRPLPEAREGLAAVAELRNPVVITARSAAGLLTTRRWLQTHGLEEYICEVYANRTDLRGGQHKLKTLRDHGIDEHVDDDGSVVLYLARHGIKRVFLRRWMMNKGLPYPENVIPVGTVLEMAALLAEFDRKGDEPRHAGSKGHGS